MEICNFERRSSQKKTSEDIPTPIPSIINAEQTKVKVHFFVRVTLSCKCTHQDKNETSLKPQHLAPILLMANQKYLLKLTQPD